MGVWKESISTQPLRVVACLEVLTCTSRSACGIIDVVSDLLSTQASLALSKIRLMFDLSCPLPIPWSVRRDSREPAPPETSQTPGAFHTFVLVHGSDIPHRVVEQTDQAQDKCRSAITLARASIGIVSKHMFMAYRR